MDKTKYILLSAVVICIVSKIFCGIGLSGILGDEDEKIYLEDETQEEGLSNKVIANKKHGLLWLISGLIIFVSWIITTIIICK